MSTMLKKFSPLLAVFTQLLFFALAAGQDLSVNVRIPSSQSVSADIEIIFPKNEKQKILSFLKNYADAERLDERIGSLKIKDDKNQEIQFSKTANGEIISATEISSVSYKLNLRAPENTLTAAHVSWLTETHGLLMLNDLLPDFGKPRAANVSIEAPENWKISGPQNQTIEKNRKNFRIADVGNSVFLIGTDWHKNSVFVGDSIINFLTVGEWNFTPDEAGKIANEILSEYEKIFGEIPFKNINVFLLPFPRPMEFERWRAETRGSNVVILSSLTTFKSVQTQRLHEQLRHELFHLWIPNNLNLTGDYSWFYESYTQYAALKTGVNLNRITFPDFLNTLGQAINQTLNRNQTASLLESSKTRWRGANSGAYAEGMLVAFLTDATLLRESRGKIDLLEIFRRVYQKHRIHENQADGNHAVLEILRSYKPLTPIIEKYILGTSNMNFANHLTGTGIVFFSSEGGKKLQVKSKLDRREKDLLNKLGYNNWRKVSGNPK